MGSKTSIPFGLPGYSQSKALEKVQEQEHNIPDFPHSDFLQTRAVEKETAVIKATFLSRLGLRWDSRDK
ncbi:hypothetical protein V6N13_149403 [Hibiscus sabdariffa]